MGETDDRYWTDPERLRALVEQHGTLSAVCRVLGYPKSTDTLSRWWMRHGLPKLTPGHPVTAPREPGETAPPSWLLAGLRKLGDTATVEQLADFCDVSPKRVREAAEELSGKGYRIELEDDGVPGVTLHRVAPDNPERLHPALFAGRDLVFGVVSDTHLGSRHEALLELELAYDVFQAEGVTDVLHAGDISCGRGIYRGQEAEIHVGTLDEVVGYVTDNYPKRDGITTRMIGGNHDLEGDAARVGLDVSQAIAHRRPDIEYLGPFSAWLGVGDDPETAPWIHLLHGKGGMSYSVSYKAQKLVDGYPGGRKPAILIPGHWHVRGQFQARGVEVLFPGCFEWQSRFLARLGLHPAVGFHLLEARFADDGSLVRYRATWFHYHAGRVVG